MATKTTKIDFAAVRATVGRFEASQKLESELAAEQASIRAAIEKATASGQTDAQSLRELQGNQTRLGLYPSKIAKRQAETAEAIVELRELLSQAGLALEYRAGELRTKAIEKLKTDFTALLAEDEHWRIDGLISEIAPHVAAIRDAENNANLCNYRDLSTVQVKTLLTRAENVFHMEQSQS